MCFPGISFCLPAIMTKNILSEVFLQLPASTALLIKNAELVNRLTSTHKYTVIQTHFLEGYFTEPFIIISGLMIHCPLSSYILKVGLYTPSG